MHSLSLSSVVRRMARRFRIAQRLSASSGGYFKLFNALFRIFFQQGLSAARDHCTKIYNHFQYKYEDLTSRPSPEVVRPPFRGEQGINFIGGLSSPWGVGEHPRSLMAAAKAVGISYDAIDFPNEVDESGHRFKVNLCTLNPIGLLHAYFTYGRKFFYDRYNIDCWFWEFDNFPDEWMPAANLVDEIWAGSRFLQRAISRKTDKPVTYMPPSISFPVSSDYSRAVLGLPEDAFIFVFSFSYRSFTWRKNPMAVVSAFLKAFPNKKSKVALVIKSQEGENYPLHMEAMQQLARTDSRIFFFNDDWKKEKVIGLYNASDALVSLHRCEGFGFSPAEAMYLGKPVVVTNYSGNMDYALADNACLVDYRLVPARKEEYYLLSDHDVWAEPDVDHAAWHMKRLYENQSLARQIGQKGSDYIRTHFSPAAVGERMARRLNELKLL